MAHDYIVLAVLAAFVAIPVGIFLWQGFKGGFNPWIPILHVIDVEDDPQDDEEEVYTFNELIEKALVKSQSNAVKAIKKGNVEDMTKHTLSYNQFKALADEVKTHEIADFDQFSDMIKELYLKKDA